MAGNTHRALVEAVLARHGQTFAEEVGIRVQGNTPAALFQLLYTAILLSARIAAGKAVEAARALREAGLTTPQKMAQASWQDRVDVITWHGYKRYDERTATMLGQTAEMVLEHYRGDLRRLRDEAERDVGREKALLTRFKGIGDVGADIFLREVQVAWDEVYPYADAKVLDAAAELGLPGDPKPLAKLVPREDFARLTSALIRVQLAKDYDEVRSAAGG
jgi:endonuclease III